jgi:uncharacterized protein DUF6065/SapC protein
VGNAMKLSFYATDAVATAPQPASPTRQWMDETSQAFAYRCLPLNVANAHGWEVLSPVAFSACWSGQSEIGAIDIRSAGDAKLQPTSIFGHGVLTFHIHGIFRTDPGWNLFATGPINRPKDGIAPLTGVIETDWAPYTFTMNWLFTRPNHWISFAEKEPFCLVFPVQRGVLDSTEPELHDIADNPTLKAELERWSRERTSFSDRLHLANSPERKERWQKRYYRGIDMQGRSGVSDHQAKLRLPDFVDKRSPAAIAAQASQPMELPLFFRKVVPLSRITHAKLGLRDGDYSFAASTHLVPLAVSEVAHAAAHYPVVFSAANPPHPLCVVGAMPGINLHVDRAGHWRAGAYIPAAVRRYPFITIISKDDPATLILGIEETAAQLSPAAPAKLFAGGEMTALCRERLDLCSRIGAAFEQTDAFAAAIAQGDLLMPVRNLAPALIAGRSSMEGLRTIDPERLASLPEATRTVWQGNRWLAALEAQIESARHWNRLLALEDAMSAPAS